MTDIPLVGAQIIWSIDPKEAGPKDSPVKVVTGGRRNDDPRYISSWGACNGDFKEASDEVKLAMLFAKFADLTINDGILPKDVHEAFMVIPEYRQGLAEVGGIDPDLV